MINYALKVLIIIAQGNALGQCIIKFIGLRAQLNLPLQGEKYNYYFYPRRRFACHWARIEWAYSPISNKSGFSNNLNTNIISIIILQIILKTNENI